MTKNKRNWTNIPQGKRFKLNMRVTVWENTHTTLRRGTIYDVERDGCFVIFDGADKWDWVPNRALTPEGGWANV